MKELKWILIYLLVILAVLAALLGFLASNSTTVTDDRNAMIEMWREVSWYAVSPQTAEHGEDSIIQWQDAGMEAHIRFLLRQPDGDILKSQVWDIQVLDIQPNYHIAHDTILTALPAGWEAFTYSGVTGTTRFWKYYEGATFPPIETLSDLVHFDSLQILSINLKPEKNILTDLSGLASRPGLKVLQLANCVPDSLEPLAELQELTHLTLEACGELELAPLKALPRLECLSLYASSVSALDALATLPRLSYLDLSGCTGYPSLEPLTKSTVAYLNLAAAPEENLPGIPDLQTVSRIPGLIGLSIAYLPEADEALCRNILAQCEHLAYLDIYDTPAAAHAEALDRKNLIAFVYE